MRKLISNKYFGLISLFVLLMITLVLTIDIFKAMILSDRYFFNSSALSFSRKSLKNYLLTSIPINFIFYWVVYQGVIGLRRSIEKRIRILNIAFLILIIIFLIGVIRWANIGFDH